MKLHLRAWYKDKNRMLYLDDLPPDVWHELDDFGTIRLFDNYEDLGCPWNQINVKWMRGFKFYDRVFYEGDIIEVGFEEYKPEKYTVKWGCDGYPAFGLTPAWPGESNVFSRTWAMDFHVRVIGNIYENREIKNVGQNN